MYEAHTHILSRWVCVCECLLCPRKLKNNAIIITSICLNFESAMDGGQSMDETIIHSLCTVPDFLSLVSLFCANGL